MPAIECLPVGSEVNVGADKLDILLYNECTYGDRARGLFPLISVSTVGANCRLLSLLI